jgi:hypothetical protein
MTKEFDWQKKPPNTRNRSANSRVRSKTTTTTFHSSGPYYSQAFKCWRVEVREVEVTATETKEAVTGSWQHERIGYMEIERKEDADNVAVLLRAVKKFSDFEFLISAVRDKVMAHSKTKGTCYVWGPNHRGIPLHKADG